MELAVAKVAVTLISITKTAHQGGKKPLQHFLWQS